MSARDIYERKSVSSGGGAQNNESRAYNMRLVARDACGAILLAHLAKITYALPDVQWVACQYRESEFRVAVMQLWSHAEDCARISSRVEIFLCWFCRLHPFFLFLFDRIHRLSSLSTWILMTIAAYQCNFAFSPMVILVPQMIPLFLTDARYYDERGRSPLG